MPTYSNHRARSCRSGPRERSRESRAQEYGVSTYCSVEELLSDVNVGIVLNLSTTDAHAQVSLEAIAAGKRVYNGKPLAIDREDGSAILNATRSQGGRGGCAPDTLLGVGIQTLLCTTSGEAGRCSIWSHITSPAWLLCLGQFSE